MGFGTYLKTDLYFSHQTFNTRQEVMDALEKVRDSMRVGRERLKQFSLMTEPNKFCPKDEDPLWWVTNELDELITQYEDDAVEEFKLVLLLDNWDSCHNEEGLAIPDPNDKGETTSRSYLDGDYVRTINSPKEDAVI